MEGENKETWIRKYVEEIFDGFIIQDENLDYLYQVKGFKLKIKIVEEIDRSYMTPGALYPGSAADNEKCVFQILDIEDNMELLHEFEKCGFKEATNYRNSQWGTYKIIMNTPGEIEKVFEIFKKTMIKYKEKF